MTRYPKAGKDKGTVWTIKELDAIPTTWKGDTLNDSAGLFGDIRVTSIGTVSVAFRYGFKWRGKKTWHYCGTYPTNAMSTIREERDKARKLIKCGIDPRAQKKADRIQNQTAIEATLLAEEQRRSEQFTFSDLYNAWIKDGVSRSDKNKFIIQSFNNHALSVLGNIEIRRLSEHHLRDLYRSIIASGKIATSIELSKDIGQMLRWAEKRKPWRALMIDGNPTELVEIKKLIPSGYIKERTRQLSIEEIRKLKNTFDETTLSYADASTKSEAERPLKKEIQIAIWLCLSTLCRIGELQMTEWKHVDFDAKIWFIPKENTKGENGKKRDQLIYLSNFALDQFKQLYDLTGNNPWAFPAIYKDGHVNIKSASKQIGDRQIQFKNRTKKLENRVENNSLVLGIEEWTPHDLRRTGATIMQQLKITRDVINLCQNHAIGSKVDQSYLLHEYADEKQEAWCKLGDRLETILNATNVVTLKRTLNG